MFDPARIVIYRPPLVVTRHEATDYVGCDAPLSERLNPLRYSITLFPGPNRWTINRYGRWNLWWSNLHWHLWRKYLRT